MIDISAKKKEIIQENSNLNSKIRILENSIK